MEKKTIVNAYLIKNNKGETNRQTDRQTDRQTETERERHRERQTDRQTDRQTETERTLRRASRSLFSSLQTTQTSPRRIPFEEESVRVIATGLKRAWLNSEVLKHPGVSVATGLSAGDSLLYSAKRILRSAELRSAVFSSP